MQYTGIWINYYPKYSKEYLLNFYSPLYYGGKIVGVLTGALGADTNFLPLLATNLFGQDMVGILCDSDGRVITATVEFTEDDHLEELLERLEITEDGKKTFSEQLNTGKQSTFECSDSDGKVIACVYADERIGWKICQIVPSASFQAIMRENTGSSYLLLTGVSLLLISYLAYMRIISGRKEKELILEKDRAVKNYEQILLATASDTYKGIRRLDLETALSDYICFENNQLKQAEVGEWTSWLEKQKGNIHPDDYYKVMEFLNLEHLRSMKDGVTYRETYRSRIKNEDGYCNTYTTTASISYTEGRRIALITTIDTTAATVLEMEQRKLLTTMRTII